MKAHLAKVSLALLSAVFLLGCQDMGSGPVGLDGLGPEFDKPTCGGQHCNHGDDPVAADPGSLFESSDSKGVLGDATCDGGAAITVGGPFGKVNFSQLRDDSHVHANVLLRDVDPGVYFFFGNQEKVCDEGTVDFDLRDLHDLSVTVGANRKAKARIGLTFGTEDRDVGVPDAHAPGSHKVWLTITGPDGLVLRSTAVDVLIPDHDGHN